MLQCIFALSVPNNLILTVCFRKFPCSHDSSLCLSYQFSYWWILTMLESNTHVSFFFARSNTHVSYWWTPYSPQPFVVVRSVTLNACYRFCVWWMSNTTLFLVGPLWKIERGMHLTGTGSFSSPNWPKNLTDNQFVFSWLLNRHSLKIRFPCPRFLWQQAIKGRLGAVEKKYRSWIRNLKCCATFLAESVPHITRWKSVIAGWNFTIGKSWCSAHNI